MQEHEAANAILLHPVTDIGVLLQGHSSGLRSQGHLSGLRWYEVISKLITTGYIQILIILMFIKTSCQLNSLLQHSCLNRCNSVCKSLLSAKLHGIKSIFAANYKHDKHYKYKICQDDRFMDINLLIAKMKAQFKKETQNSSNVHTTVELCAIREGVANCDVMSCTNSQKSLFLLINQ